VTSLAVRRHVIAPANPAPIDPRWSSRLTAVYGLDWGMDGDPDGSLYYARAEPQMRNVLGTMGGMHSYYTTDVPVPTMTEVGRGLYYDGTRNAYTTALTGLANGASADEACIVCFIPMSSTGSQNLMGYANVWSTSLADYGRGIGIEGGNLMAWGASAQNGKKVSVTLPALNTFNTVGVRFSSSGAVYLNGVEMANGSDLSHSWGYYLACGSAHAAIEGTGTAKFTGKLALRAWFRDGLTNAELEELTANPLKLFSPRRRLYLVAAPASTGRTATANITDTDDAITAAATVNVSAAAGITDATDTSAAVGAVSIAGSASIADSTDTASATSAVSIAAALSVTDSADSITSAGTVGFSGITADASITDTADSITAAGTVSIAASASIADATDATNAAAAVALSASLSVTDSTDSISAAGTVGGSLSGLTAAEIAAAVWAEPLSGATTASQILSGMADLLRDRGYLP